MCLKSMANNTVGALLNTNKSHNTKKSSGWALIVMLCLLFISFFLFN